MNREYRWWIEGICLVKDNNRLLGLGLVWKSNEIVSIFGFEVEFLFFGGAGEGGWIRIELSCLWTRMRHSFFCCDY